MISAAAGHLCRPRPPPTFSTGRPRPSLPPPAAPEHLCWSAAAGIPPASRSSSWSPSSSLTCGPVHRLPRHSGRRPQRHHLAGETLVGFLPVPAQLHCKHRSCFGSWSVLSAIVSVLILLLSVSVLCSHGISHSVSVGPCHSFSQCTPRSCLTFNVGFVVVLKCWSLSFSQCT